MLHKRRVFQILIEGLTIGPNYCALSHFHTHPIGLQSVAGRQSHAWPLAHCHVPDYWGAEIDWGPRSMYTLPRCLITGGRDRLGAEIHVHPATVPDYWVPRSMYALPWCLITGGPRSMYTLPRSTAEIDWGPRSMYTLSWCLITGGPRSTGG